MGPNDRFDIDLDLERPGLSSQITPLSKAAFGSFKNFLGKVGGGVKIVAGLDEQGPLQKGELGRATRKTLVGSPEELQKGNLGGAFGLAAQAIQTPARALGSSFLTFKEQVSGKPEKATFSGPLRGLVGAEEVTSFRPIVKESRDIARNLGATEREEVFAVPFVIGSLYASDFFGVGKAKKPLNQLIDELAKTSDTGLIRRTVDTSFPNLNPEVRDAFVNVVSRTDDPRRVSELVTNVARQSAEEAVRNAPRRFTPDNLPPVREGESLAVFRRTDGDQYIFNNLDDARRYFNDDLTDIEIGTVPTNAIRSVADDAQGSRSGVGIIPSDIADDIVRTNRVLDQEILNDADVQQFINTEVLPQVTSSPKSPEAVLGRTPSPLQTIRKRESTFLRDKLQQAQSISRRAAVATRQDVKQIQNELVELVGDLPLRDRGKFIATIKNIQTPAQLQRSLPDIQRRVDDVLARVAEQEQKKNLRKQVRELISQKQLRNTEALRRAYKLPKLTKMTVDQLRDFARTLAEYQPKDQFLSQRLIETIDRTNLKGARTRREVQTKLAQAAGVPIEDLQKISKSWFDNFLYDTALARQNPYYDVVVGKTNSALVEGNIRFARLEDELDDLLKAARKSRPRGVGERLVPTDKKVFEYLEAPNKEDFVEALTPEELKLANFIQERYADAWEYLNSRQMIDSKVEDYVTHIRRSGLEAYREDGFIAAIKDTFKQYQIERAQLNILNEKTGDVVPMDKYFAYAQRRTGNLEPTKNLGRSVKAYFQAFERKRALDNVVPELQAYAQAVTPTKKTGEGLDFDPSLKTFLKQYINNKRGRPVTAFLSPGSPPDVIVRGLVSFVRLRDLGLSPIHFVSANVGEQVSTYIGQGTKAYATGLRRMNSKKGKRIVEKYRGFVGRSPWKEISDTSKNFPDKLFSLMLSGFHDASVRANKQGLLGVLTKEEWASETISPERLAQIRLDMGRWRALDNSASVFGSTGEMKMATQYKAWAVPHLMTTGSNLRSLLQSARRAENPFSTREGQEFMRQSLLTGTVALIVYSYFQEEDNSPVGQLLEKATREALSSIGALDSEFWLATPRAWQYLQDVNDALWQLITLEEYKSGEKAGTLKGDDALLREITPAPIRQAQRAVDDTGEEGLDLGDGLDLDLDLGEELELDLGDLELDLELDEISI